MIEVGIEIERKYLVLDEPCRGSARSSTRIFQAYFARTPLLRGRIRVIGDKAFIGLKSSSSLKRHEFEYEIPKRDAWDIIREFNIEPIIMKTRYAITYRDKPWVIDVFEGANEGLVLAEVELRHENEVPELPPWAGKEVTHDHRFGNSSLARYPFASWKYDEVFRAE